MTEQEGPQEPMQLDSAAKPRVSTRMVIAFAVIAVFAGIVVAKYLPASRVEGLDGQVAQQSMTSIRNDASADYEAAVKTGKPIYVLFHSLS